jgi:hypothetical protein
VTHRLSARDVGQRHQIDAAEQAAERSIPGLKASSRPKTCFNPRRVGEAKSAIGRGDQRGIIGRKSLIFKK